MNVFCRATSTERLKKEDLKKDDSRKREAFLICATSNNFLNDKNDKTYLIHRTIEIFTTSPPLRLIKDKLSFLSFEVKS